MIAVGGSQLVGVGAPLFLPHISIAVAAVGLGDGFTLRLTLPLDSAHSADEANAWNALVMAVGYLIVAAGRFLSAHWET
jgi:CP family cyanate transporter-like MFS transporter